MEHHEAATANLKTRRRYVWVKGRVFSVFLRLQNEDKEDNGQDELTPTTGAVNAKLRHPIYFPH